MTVDSVRGSVAPAVARAAVPQLQRIRCRALRAGLQGHTDGRDLHRIGSQRYRDCYTAGESRENRPRTTYAAPDDRTSRDIMIVCDCRAFETRLSLTTGDSGSSPAAHWCADD